MKKAAHKKASAKKVSSGTEKAARPETSAKKMAAAVPTRPTPVSPGKQAGAKEAVKAKQAPHRPRPLRLT